MPVEELEKVTDDVGNDVPKMIHICWKTSPDVALCGTELRGRWFGALDEDGPQVDCVVCVELFGGAA